jgi:hypothetical protein
MFAGKEDPKVIWDMLKDKYEKPGALTAFGIFQKLFQASFTEGLSMRSQIDELHALRQEGANAGITVTDQHYAFIILQALPSSYSMLYVSLLSTVDMTKIDPTAVASRIFEEETRRSSDPSVAAIKTEQSRFTGTCNYCKKVGHKEKVCRKKQYDKKEKQRARPSVPNNSAITSTASVVEVAQSIPVSFYLASQDSKHWMMDSGCTDHMTPYRSDFATYSDLPQALPITLGDSKSILKYIGVGTVKGHTLIGGQRQEITFDHVLYAPGLGSRFLSIWRLTKKGFEVKFNESESFILNGTATIGIGKLYGRQYWLDIHLQPQLHASTTPTPCFYNPSESYLASATWTSQLECSFQVVSL